LYFKIKEYIKNILSTDIDVGRRIILQKQYDNIKIQEKEDKIENDKKKVNLTTCSRRIQKYTQNIYVRRVMSGEFVQINRYLLKDLIELGLWNTDMKNELIKHNGSVQQLDLPDHIKELYKTVWEIKQKKILDMAIDRAPFIDQSMSLNIHMINPTKQKLSSMHFHGWSSGLKTGMYYLRTRPKADAIQFTVDQSSLKNSSQNENVPNRQQQNEEDFRFCIAA